VQAGSSGLGFAGSGDSGFLGGKLLVVDWASLVGMKIASLVAVDLASFGASW